MQPARTDPAGVWQAWVEQGRGEQARQERFKLVPAKLRWLVASHMRTVKAIEARHQ